MSFIIRQIAKRADGGDIIRTRTLDTREISVGRGTDCDIQLADLGIMLRHVRLTRLADGVVALEALGGVPVEVDGRFLTRAELKVADRPAIKMASHRLCLAPGDAADSVEITAERVIAASDSAEASAETEIFSLMGAMPSRRAMAWTLALLVLIGGLLAPLVTMALRSDGQRPEAMVIAAERGAANRPTPLAASTQPDIIWSSGPLSSAHAGLANSCGACHLKAFEATPDRACIACHKPSLVPDHAGKDRLDKGRPTPAGLGLAVANVQHGMGLEPGRCATCHKEHEGPKGTLAMAANFCEGCHDGLSGRLKDTRLNDVGDWARHPQFRPTLVVQTGAPPRLERLSLDETPLERSGLIYPHALHLSRTNAVANMVRKQGLPAQEGGLGCAYCHQPDADGLRFKPIEMEANCGACHDLAFARDGNVLRTLPHGKPAQVAGIVRDFFLSQTIAPRPGVQTLSARGGKPGPALPLGATTPARAEAAIDRLFQKDGLCAECHETRNTGAANAAERWQVQPVALTDHYLPKGLFPHGKHRTHDRTTGEAACLACHEGVSSSKAATDVLLPKVSGCRTCHGGSDSRTNVAATCDTCHGYHGTGAPPALPVLAAVSGRQGR
jgi:predicted CXXCH cytochrome family protein